MNTLLSPFIERQGWMILELILRVMFAICYQCFAPTAQLLEQKCTVGDKRW